MIPDSATRSPTSSARPILAAARELAERATAASGPLGGRLRLGVIPTAGAYLIPHLLPVLRRDYPGLKTYIREDLTGPLLEQLRATELDAILASPPLRLDGLEREQIMVEEYLAALPPGHRLAREAEIRPADLAGERVLMLEEGHCMREQTIALCAWKTGVDVTPQATSIEGLRQMVSLGAGCTFLPRLATVGPFARLAPIVIRPLSGPRPTRTLILIWRRTHPRAGELRQLGRVLREGMDERSGIASG